MLNRPDAWNWDTNELVLQITNYEPWYRLRNELAQEHLEDMATQMEDLFMQHQELYETIDTHLVDWEAVAYDALSDLPDLQ